MLLLLVFTFDEFFELGRAEGSDVDGVLDAEAVVVVVVFFFFEVLESAREHEVRSHGYGVRVRERARFSLVLDLDLDWIRLCAVCRVCVVWGTTNYEIQMKLEVDKSGNSHCPNFVRERSIKRRHMLIPF